MSKTAWLAELGRFGARIENPSAGEPAAAECPRLEQGIISEAIPAFFIGRDKDGFWVAREVKGRIGGIFLLKTSALSFARGNSWPDGLATVHPHQRFELDLENSGNPLVAYLKLPVRLIRRAWQRMAARTALIQ